MRALYICYLPSTEPLVETQVVAYLKGLANAGHEMHLLTFELDDLTTQQIQERTNELAADGVTWHRLRYHKRPSLPATLYDIARGILRGIRLVRHFGIEAVHARNHVPGVMALALRKFTGVKFIFDIRGLMAEEYADGGIWKEGSIPFRLTKNVERRCIRKASGIVVLTHRVRQYLFGDSPSGSAGQTVAVIPTTADVELIAQQKARRNEIREALSIRNSRVLVYAGKFSTWYMAREMASFFEFSLRTRPDGVWLILTQSDPGLIYAELQALDVPPDRYRIYRVSPEDVGAYLAAADYAVSFIRASFSKISSSPTKIGEYLAAGLPTIVSAGVGDTDELLTRTDTGIVVHSHTEADYEASLDEIERLLGDDVTSGRCAQVAHAELSLEGVGIPRYVELYNSVSSTAST